MIGKTHRIRRTATAVGIVASLAAWAAQPSLPYDGRSPDTREAAEQAKLAVVVDVRSPDTREAAEQVSSRNALDARSPDARDAGFRSLAETRAVSPDRFSWGDFGIGVGVAFGLMLLLAGLAASASAARQKRGDRTGPATT
jgi:hypothetical protein